MSRFSCLEDWLAWQETLHPKSIDLGLDRVNLVRERLGIPRDWSMPVITVAGTNGKGTHVELLKCIYRTAGYRVACFTSPHLWRYEERIFCDEGFIAGQDLCELFDAIDSARADVSLTYFEFSTLAALLYFWRQQPDVVILEVGLGGRLDAVNVINPRLTIISSIDLDHMDYLGNTREAVAKEKLGICREGVALICADPNPPHVIAETAKQLHLLLYQIGDAFSSRVDGKEWTIRIAEQCLCLPADINPQLQAPHQRQNAASTLMAVSLMSDRLPVDSSSIESAFKQFHLAGRCEVTSERPLVIQDVAHNPQGARALALWLSEQKTLGSCYALFACMADKDIDGLVQPLLELIDEWHFVKLVAPRAADPEQLSKALLQNRPAARTYVQPSMQMAVESIMTNLQENDTLLIFGSFFTVAEYRAYTYGKEFVQSN